MRRVPAVESIPAFASALPFAGRSVSKSLGRLSGNEGSLQPFVQLRDRRPWGARAASEEGSLYPPRHAASHARRGEVLRSRRLGPRRFSSPFQPIVGATGGGVVAAPASVITKGGGRRRSTFRRPCSAGKRASMGLTRLAARSSRKGWAIARRLPPKGGGREARANAEGERPQKGRAFKAGENRTLEGRARASLSLSCRSR